MNNPSPHGKLRWTPKRFSFHTRTTTRHCVQNLNLLEGFDLKSLGTLLRMAGISALPDFIRVKDEVGGH
jgi:hypothetical protein